MSIVIPSGVDRQRYRVAVHELGHLTAWERLDGRVVSVTLPRWGTGGLVKMAWPDNPSPDNMHGYLIGAWAGHVADQLWCAETGDRHDHSTCGHDMRSIKRGRRRYPDAKRWSDSALQAEARRLCESHWSTILRRAEALARRGRL